ncbi:MAG: hypothetical protein LBN09_03725 [Clostridioides sp.]|nr:hypothetical protein [Clostridioides sp.]
MKMKKLLTVGLVLVMSLFVGSSIKNTSYGEEITKGSAPSAKEATIVDNKTVKNDIDSESKKDEAKNIDDDKDKATTNKDKSADKAKNADRAKEKVKNADKEKDSAKNKDKSVDKDKAKNKEKAKDAEEDKTADSVNNVDKDKAKDTDKAKGIEEDKDSNNSEAKSGMTKEGAYELLKKKLPDVDFSYQGDENDFEYIRDHGHSGYVYLPMVDGDLAYFVDKNTSEVYYFHPSGYLELVDFN